MNQQIREEIKQNLRSSITRYLNRFSHSSTQPLDLLIPVERKIRSVVGGLETSMGTTVWEPIAKTIAKSNGFEVIEEKILMPDPFPVEVKIELDRQVSLRENRATWLSAKDCISNFKKVCRNASRLSVLYVRPSAGTGVDLLIKKNGKEYAFDIKTVQPNMGSIKSFNKQIMEWYAYRLYRDPEVEIECKIAYPYNPYPNDFWTHTPHNRGILEPKIDAVVESEFWDFLSGNAGTYNEIRDIFLELNREGFGNELSQLIKRI